MPGRLSNPTLLIKNIMPSISFWTLSNASPKKYLSKTISVLYSYTPTNRTSFRKEFHSFSTSSPKKTLMLYCVKSNFGNCFNKSQEPSSCWERQAMSTDTSKSMRLDESIQITINWCSILPWSLHRTIFSKGITTGTISTSLLNNLRIFRKKKLPLVYFPLGAW